MNALPQRSVGALGIGVGSSGAAGAGLSAARVSASQALQDEADSPTAAPIAASFLAMLSAADAGTLGESADGLGKSATSLPLAAPDEQRSSDDASASATLAVAPDIAAPLPPTAPATVDPAMLLAQGALSVQAAPAPTALAAASSSAAATAVALDDRGGIRAATAERFGAPAQRLASATASTTAGATAQPAPPESLAPAGMSMLAASAMAPAAQTLEVPATSVKPHDAPGTPAAPAQATPFAGAAASSRKAFASGSASAVSVAAAPVGAKEGAAAVPTTAALVAADGVAGPARAADLTLATSRVPGASAAPAATPLSPVPVERPATVSALAQATRPPFAGGVDGTTSPGSIRPDAPLPKPDEAEALRLGAATTPERAIEPTGPVDAVGVTERSARRLPSVASGIPNSAGSPQGKRDAAIESASLRIEAPSLAGRFGREEDPRSDRDGSAAPGAFALPAASGAVPVGAVAPNHAAQAAGLHTASVERIVEQVSWWLAQNAGSAEFSIDMPGGQPLSVSVQMRDNEAQVIFRSDQPELRQLIGQALPQLKESFVQQGLLLADASVSAQADGGAAGGAGYSNHGGQAQPLPYRASGRQHNAEERVTAAAGSAPSAVVGRRAPFGPAGRSLDLYV